MTGRADAICLRPVGLAEANDFVRLHHRHHGKARGHKFSVGVEDERGCLRGVAIAGRPVARLLDNGRRLEVLRVATDGTHNACSMLYGACARAAEGLGYRRSDVLTYILETESGASLRAAGWVLVKGDSPGGSWSTSSRYRYDKAPTIGKQRWHAALPEAVVEEEEQGVLL